MILNLERLLCGHAARLRYVRRFGTCRVHHPESVAEHCYYVALYASLIARWLTPRATDSPVDWQQLMLRVVLHDLEESRSGDMPRPFKYSADSERLADALNNASRIAFEQVASEIVGESTAEELTAIWAAAKAPDLEGRIVEFADFLSVVSFFAQEGRDRSDSLEDHLVEMRGYVEQFDADAYDFIRPLVDDVYGILQNVFGEVF